MTPEEGKNLLQNELFDFAEFGFTNITPFTDNDVGVSFQKKDKVKEGYSSLFHVFFSRKEFNDDEIRRKPLIVTAVYGEERHGGVGIRGITPQNLKEPIDLDFYDEFYYDIDKKELYKRKTKISGAKLLKFILSKHFKTTKPIRGFYVRFKIAFLRFWLPKICQFVSKIFYYLLLVISGDKYTYTLKYFSEEEETLNGEKINFNSKKKNNFQTSTSAPETPQDAISTVTNKKGKTFNFFGNDVRQWPLFIYSLIHLAGWGYLKNTGFPTGDIEEVFNSSFLLILYVILSFTLLETIIPFMLKKLMKLCAVMAFNAPLTKIHL